MRHAFFCGLAIVSIAVGCGGSTQEGSGLGGTSGSGGKGATGGAGGSGNAGATGGAGNSGGTSGGAGGSVGGSGGSTGGAGNYGGGGGATGGSGGCDPNACGPDGAPCCDPNSGCAVAGGSLSCNCNAKLIWECSTGSGGSGGSGGGPCGGVTCGFGTTCCAGQCRNLANDPYNCGSCGTVCPGPHPFCSGTCGQPPCFGSEPPLPGSFCCGQTACKDGQFCCEVQGPGPSIGPTCYTPTATQATCPIGCLLCQ
jgi:hypothetical protein